MKHILFIMAFVVGFVGCATPAPPAPEPTPPAPKDLRANLESSIAECTADPQCLETLKKDEHLLKSCPWYSAIGCSAAVAAAVTCCAATEGELCIPCVELVAELGCCDCLPSGKVRDSCKSI